VEITVAVFLQTPYNEISLGDIDEALLLIAVDPAIKVSIEFVQLLHLEHTYKLFLCLYDQRVRRSYDYNIVDIKTKEDIFIFIYKATDVRDKCFETVFLEYRNDGVIPLFRRAI